MTARRTAFLGLLLCLACAVPARAEDPSLQTEPLKTNILEDVVDGIGGILGVLVGPPISSPTPYLEGRLPPAKTEPPRKEGAEPVNVAVPSPAPIPPAAATVAPAASPVSVAPPAPAAPTSPASMQPPAVKNVAAQPPAPPPPRPAPPVLAAPTAPAAPATVPAPACSIRVAATATLEQMRRLPRCP